jgi:S-layer homology domain
MENEMKNGKRVQWIVLAALVLSLLTAAIVRAETGNGVPEQLADFHRSWVAAGQPETKSVPMTPNWGLDASEILNVHAYEFQANTTSDVILDDGNGYRYFGAPGVPYMAAPVSLPPGAKVGALGLSQCSASDGDLVIALYDNGIGGAGGGGGTIVAGPMVSHAGCNSEGVSADYTHPYEFSHPLYLVVWFVNNNFDATTKFNNAVIGWKRQVSPAPGNATFGDVPTSDFGFQFVEALAASGISGGCGGGNYCPDSPVTRRQMAIFLAKALGLNWPN